MRSRNFVPAALSTAVLLVLAGCSTSTEVSTGVPAAASTAAFTAPSATPTAQDAADPNAPDASTVLDGGTELWFATYCLAADNVTQYYSSPDPAGTSLPDLQAQIVETYTNITGAAEAGAEALRKSPEPDPALVGNAPALAIERFTALAGIFGDGASTIAALTPADVDELKAATQPIQQQATTTGPEIMGDLDPAVLAAARAIPECAGGL